MTSHGPINGNWWFFPVFYLMLHFGSRVFDSLWGGLWKTDLPGLLLYLQLFLIAWGLLLVEIFRWPSNRLKKYRRHGWVATLVLFIVTLITLPFSTHWFGTLTGYTVITALTSLSFCIVLRHRYRKE